MYANIYAKMAATLWLATLALFALIDGPARPIRPDPALTPGATLTTDTPTVCRGGYARSVRAVSADTRRHVFQRYGIAPLPGERFELDHLIPLELGGSNDIANLWPEPYGGPWNARDKDHLENVLHQRVCAGQEPLSQAQGEIAHDWIAAYGHYVAPQPPSLLTGLTGGSAHGH